MMQLLFTLVCLHRWALMQHNNLCTCNGSDRESHVTDARTEENALQGNEQSTAAAQKASKKVLWQSATLLNVSCSFAGYHALKRLARVRSFSGAPLSSSEVQHSPVSIRAFLISYKAWWDTCDRTPIGAELDQAVSQTPRCTADLMKNDFFSGGISWDISILFEDSIVNATATKKSTSDSTHARLGCASMFRRTIHAVGIAHRSYIAYI